MLTTVGQLKEELAKYSDDRPIIIKYSSFEDNYAGVAQIDETYESGNFVPTVYVKCS